MASADHVLKQQKSRPKLILLKGLHELARYQGQITEPFRIGSKLSQSGKHKKPRRESRLFSFKSRVFWGFLLTAGPSCSSLPARSASRIARFLVPTPSRIAESLGLSRLTGTSQLTELGL
jgi:hypothetical protein